MYAYLSSNYGHEFTDDNQKAKQEEQQWQNATGASLLRFFDKKKVQNIRGGTNIPVFSLNKTCLLRLLQLATVLEFDINSLLWTTASLGERGAHTQWTWQYTNWLIPQPTESPFWHAYNSTGVSLRFTGPVKIRL